MMHCVRYCRMRNRTFFQGKDVRPLNLAVLGVPAKIPAVIFYDEWFYGWRTSTSFCGAMRGAPEMAASFAVLCSARRARQNGNG